MQFDNVSKIDTEAREIALPLGDKVVKFNVRHLDVRSIAYVKVREAVNKPYKHLIQAEKLDDNTDRKLAITAFVRHALRGWDGITSGGEPVPYNEENAVAFFMQATPTFYALITEAQSFDNFAVTEGEAKN